MSRTRGHVPMRTCLACGARRPKAGLIRLVLRQGRVREDSAGTLPGRGGYCCPQGPCRDMILGGQGRKKLKQRIIRALGGQRATAGIQSFGE